MVKIYYEKYDDTVQYLGKDKVSDWQPSSENIAVEVCDEKIFLTTEYESGLVATKEMTIIDCNDGRLIAQHLDVHMGLTVFVQNPNESNEATLTLVNNDYIVGRYLRTVEEKL